MKLLSNYPTEVLILLFLIVTFLQSGIDKLLDWKGNVSFITGHFKNSPLKNGFDFFLRLVKWPKIAVKKSQNFQKF